MPAPPPELREERRRHVAHVVAAVRRGHAVDETHRVEGSRRRDARADAPARERMMMRPYLRHERKMSSNTIVSSLLSGPVIETDSSCIMSS